MNWIIYIRLHWKSSFYLLPRVRLSCLYKRSLLCLILQQNESWQVLSREPGRECTEVTSEEWNNKFEESLDPWCGTIGMKVSLRRQHCTARSIGNIFRSKNKSVELVERNKLPEFELLVNAKFTMVASPWLGCKCILRASPYSISANLKNFITHVGRQLHAKLGRSALCLWLGFFWEESEPLVKF